MSADQLPMPVGDISANYSPNPMVRLHGRGPEGELCRSCRHLVRSNHGTARSYLKCDRRSLSRCSSSDQRAK